MPQTMVTVRLTGLFCVALSFHFTPIASASVMTSASAYASSISGEKIDGGETFSSADATSSGLSGGALGSASSHARVTALKHVAAYAGAQASLGVGINGGSPPANAGFANASASSHDDFVITATDPFGMPLSSIYPFQGGFFICVVNANGYAYALGGEGPHAFASAFVTWTVSIGGQGGGGGLIVDTNNGPIGEPPAPIVLTIPWTFGQSIALDLSAAAQATASILNGNGAPAAEADFFNSLDWGGITEVLDQAGNPISNFTAMGTDGTTDWATPALVPEPSSIMLAAFGLAGLVAWGWRRRKCRLPSLSRSVVSAPHFVTFQPNHKVARRRGFP